MFDVLPSGISPGELARSERHVTARVSVERMERLGAAVDTPDLTGGTHADVDLRFELDSQARCRITGRVSADIRLRCQRCLEPMRARLESTLQLIVVASDELTVTAEPGYEPFAVSDEGLDIADLIEDELILALPMFPVHDPASCPNPIGAEIEEPSKRENPFAVLKVLKAPQ